MSETIVAPPGTTLFHLAAQYLDGAIEWTRIAELNNISDPFVIGMSVLIIPSRRSQV